LSVDDKGTVSIKGPAEWKDAGASVDIKIGAPSERDTAGEITVPMKHLGIGTNLTEEGKVKGLNIKIGAGAGGPEISSRVTTLEKVKNFFTQAMTKLGERAKECPQCFMDPH
jgi:hypothetical protein